MHFIAVLKQYKLYVSIFFLAILLLGILTAIAYFKSSANLGNSPAINNTGNYVGYDVLQQQITAAAMDTNINNSPYFPLFNTSLKTLRDPAMNGQTRYASLVQAHQQLINLYTFTGNPKIRTLLDALNTFTKNNFAKEYNQSAFSYPCQDPTCSDDPPNQQFLNIVNEVKTSDFPTTVKNNLAQYLLANSYLAKKDSLAKTRTFLVIAQTIQSYSSLTKTGINTKIADDLYNYTKGHYLKDFINLLSAPNAVASGLFKPGDLPKK